MADSDFIVVSFTVGTFFAGTAHPNSNYVTVNYDIKSGRDIQLKDLFKPNSKYFAAISRYCIPKLKKKLGADASEMVDQGAAPREENYKNWCITGSGLLILFDSYQVTSYAAGPQQVMIPFSRIADLIEPLGPVGKYAK